MERLGCHPGLLLYWSLQNGSRSDPGSELQNLYS